MSKPLHWYRQLYWNGVGDSCVRENETVLLIQKMAEYINHIEKFSASNTKFSNQKAVGLPKNIVIVHFRFTLHGLILRLQCAALL